MDLVSGADREAKNDGQGRAAEGRTDGRADEGKARQQDKPRNRLPLIIAIAAVIAVLIVYLIYWLATRNEVSTDDAYTDGRAISIAANVSGYVTALNVNDNSFVHQGELLAVIDPREDQGRCGKRRPTCCLPARNWPAPRQIW